jgi:hypothetical protein
MMIFSCNTLHLHPAGAAPDIEWSGANPADAAPPRVLSRSLIQRLALLNNAVRELRAMGLAIVSQSIENRILAGGPPSIRIHRDPAMSIAPLLDNAGPRVFIRHNSAQTTLAYCLFKNVMVVWEERQ